MSVFAQAFEMARSGKHGGSPQAQKLYALAHGKMKERAKRRKSLPDDVAEALEFELKLLQSLSLCGWELDKAKATCRKGFISQEALELAEEVLKLAGAKWTRKDPSLNMARDELDRVLKNEAN